MSSAGQHNAGNPSTTTINSPASVVATSGQPAFNTSELDISKRDLVNMVINGVQGLVLDNDVRHREYSNQLARFRMDQTAQLQGVHNTVTQVKNVVRPLASANLVQRLDTLEQFCHNQNEVHNSLAGLPDRVDSLSDRVDSLSGRVDSLSDRVDSLSDRVDSLSDRVNSISVRVEAMEVAVRELNTRMQVMEVAVGELNTRMQAMEVGLEALNARVQAVEVRLDQSLELIKGMFQRIDANFGALRADIARLGQTA
ncbi:hypothetical protein DL546_008437 [Coniochaeta pulveracea]|uniref:t-SNARE coiled-coil homology domain-containing protein n=1 Tax=Coniochaeta pulveracea TaxID=177199 RepID=A0A420YNK4_9PEZI|nr:hypothetical protein DL546_008437 [Coniochaeta pulveracea]